LVGLFAGDPGVAECLDRAEVGVDRALDLTLVAAARPFFVAALAERTRRPVLVVTSTFRQAEDFAADLRAVLGESRVAYYPAWETLPFERLSPRSDTVGRRLEVLRRVAGVDELPAPDVVVAPVRALLQPQAAGLSALKPVRIEAGADYDLTGLATELVRAA
jgi:transcription-repair coupling factor (superfamily II helicase)